MAGRSDPVNIGIAGCGEVAGEKHLRVLHDIPRARVVALADVDGERLERVAERHRVARRYPDVSAMVDHPGLEAVGVCVPAGVHAEVAVAAILAGKSVYVEKPLALTLEDADRILQAASGKRARHLMGFHMRFHRLIREARARLAAGEIGNIESIRTTWFSPREDGTLPSWRNRRSTGGGALVEIGAHCYDLWRYLTSAEVVRVFAMARHGSREDEAAAITARMSGGIIASAHLSERTSHEIEVEICGARGRLRVGCQRFDGLEAFPLGSAPGHTDIRLRALRRFAGELPGGLAGMAKGGDYLASYRGAWEHFCRIVRDGEEPECTLEDGRRALAISLAAARSVDQGTPVSP
ncbi:MAG TPA: Gfo/Idh/MocA family oxidoreductase [Bryobacteraceae bacterium]|nr:Gfo/Idh/MocA family oxidoreductase [Bryobacteraceae bacterium]